jgi:hypothetical protein
MGQFRGTLLIGGSQSSVNGDILLMAGDQDPNVAMSDATSFVKRKGFQSGFAIVVTGTMGQVGPTSGIIMTDASASPVVAPAPAAMLAVPAAQAGGRPSSPGRKRTAASKKKKKKSTAVKKKTGRKKAPPRAAKGKTAKKSRGSR